MIVTHETSTTNGLNQFAGSVRQLVGAMRIRMMRLGIMLAALVLSSAPVWAVCPTSIAKLAGTYTGAGTMYDYDTSLALSEITTFTASLTITSTGSGTMTMYAKTATTQGATTLSLSGVVRSLNTSTCIAEYYISSSSTSTSKVAISNSGTVVTYSDYTASSGKTRVFQVRMEKI